MTLNLKCSCNWFAYEQRSSDFRYLKTYKYKASTTLVAFGIVLSIIWWKLHHNMSNDNLQQGIKFPLFQYYAQPQNTSVNNLWNKRRRLHGESSLFYNYM